MKKLIILLILSLSYMVGYAQSQPTGVLYFRITPKEVANEKDQTEGIYKSVKNHNISLYKDKNLIFFSLVSVSRDINIGFAYINYNPTVLQKVREVYWDDTMEIITKPVSWTSTVNIYNLDTFFQAYTKEQLIAWFKSMDIENKKVYFIDSRDYATGTLKLIQVTLLDYGPLKF